MHVFCCPSYGTAMNVPASRQTGSLHNCASSCWGDHLPFLTFTPQSGINSSIFHKPPRPTPIRPSLDVGWLSMKERNWPGDTTAHAGPGHLSPHPVANPGPPEPHPHFTTNPLMRVVKQHDLQSELCLGVHCNGNN